MTNTKCQSTRQARHRQETAATHIEAVSGESDLSLADCARHEDQAPDIDAGWNNSTCACHLDECLLHDNGDESIWEFTVGVQSAVADGGLDGRDAEYVYPPGDYFAHYMRGIAAEIELLEKMNGFSIPPNTLDTIVAIVLRSDGTSRISMAPGHRSRDVDLAILTKLRAMGYCDPEKCDSVSDDMPLKADKDPPS